MRRGEERRGEERTLGEFTKIKRGIRVTSNQLTATGKHPVYQNSMTPLGYHNYSNQPANSTFIICAGAAGEIGYSYEDFWAADDCYCFECSEKLNGRYLFYFLKSRNKYIKSKVRKASIPRLSKRDIENIVISPPSLSEQLRIVSILDRFYKLCNDISDGIPAEIEARRKQYEYYRDKLLTFKEA